MDENELAATAIAVSIDRIFAKCDALLSSITDEAKYIFKKGIGDYLQKQKDRYSQIRTLLRSDPVDLYSIYFLLNLTSRNMKSITSTSNIKNIFAKKRYVTIIGDAGSGKSTLIKHLFLNAIFTDFAIPILVELRYLNDYDNNFIEYVIEKSLELKMADNSTIFEKFLEHGKFVFFLDGYDELYTKRKSKIIGDIDNFISCYNKNYYILTSRPISDIEQLNQFTDYFMKDLSYEEGEIKKFVLQVLHDEHELASKVNESVDSNIDTNKYIKEFLVNPLLLTLYILILSKKYKSTRQKIYFLQTCY